MRRLILASAVLLACSCTAVSASVSRPAAGGRSLSSVAALSTKIVTFQRATWRWERVMGTTPTQTAGRVLTEMSTPDVRQAVSVWRSRAEAAYRHAHRPPHLKAWLCIHRYEGSWSDTGAPYYGGLQMSLTFQERYGWWLLRHKGTADHWTPLEQIWTAERALKSRGFWPWPNTARYCGLL